jgi:hypothetical protein
MIFLLRLSNNRSHCRFAHANEKQFKKIAENDSQRPNSNQQVCNFSTLSLLREIHDETDLLVLRLGNRIVTCVSSAFTHGRVNSQSNAYSVAANIRFSRNNGVKRITAAVVLETTNGFYAVFF